MGQRNLPRSEINRRRQIRRRLFMILGLAGILYISIPLLFGDMGIFKYFGMLKMHHRVTKEIRDLTTKNDSLHQQIEALRSDPLTVERIAREQLGLVKEGEVVYQFQSERGK